MTSENGEPDLRRLSAWQAELQRQVDGLQTEIQEQQATLAHAEERLALVTQLLEIEKRSQGIAVDPEAPDEQVPSQELSEVGLAQQSKPNLEDAVEGFLREAGEPLHISKIREALVAEGVPIPGRGDDANIIVRLRRLDDRFTRTARGTYALAEWGLPELSTKKRKRRQAAAR